MDSGNEIQGRKRVKKCPKNEKVPAHSWVANLQSNSSRLEDMEGISSRVKYQTDTMSGTLFGENLGKCVTKYLKKISDRYIEN